MRSNNNKCNTNLANYFSAQPLFFDGDLQKKPHLRKCVEQPWQQTKAELWDEVTDTLCNLDFIQAKAVAKMTYDLVKDFNDVLEVIPDNAENIKEEKARLARMYKYTRDLIACAKSEIRIDELEIPESITPWANEKIAAETDRINKNPSRIDRLKEFVFFLIHEVRNLQNFAFEFPHFSIQQAWNYSKEGPVGETAKNGIKKAKEFLLLRSNITRPHSTQLSSIILRTDEHIDRINAVFITSDGKWAISVSRDKYCILWDLSTGEAIRKIQGHTDSIWAISITQESQTTVLSSYNIDLNISIWDLTNPNALKEFKQLNCRSTISFIPPSQRAVFASEDWSRIRWAPSSSDDLQSLRGNFESLTAITIFLNGERAISGSSDNSCVLWDLTTGKAIDILKGHSSFVTAIAITIDGKKAVSSSMDHSCIIWDLTTGKALRFLRGHRGIVNCISITPDGCLAISGSIDKTCILWDLNTGKKIKILKGHSDSVNEISITADGKFAISCSNDKTCILWDLTTLTKLMVLEGHSDSVTTVYITPDGQKAISGSEDYTCILWDLTKPKYPQVEKGHTDEITSLSHTPNGEFAISGSRDKTCILWNLKTGKSIWTLKGHSTKINTVSIAPNGQLAISGDNEGTCFPWDLHNGQHLVVMWNHFVPEKSSVTSLAITPDGKRVISSSEDSTCIIWKIPDGDMLITLKGHSSKVNSYSISLDGKRGVSSSDDGTSIYWDIISGKALKIFNEHTNCVNAVSITPDGKSFISGSDDRICLLWNFNKELSTKILAGHSNSIKKISITPDGRKALTLSIDGNCIFWDLISGEILNVKQNIDTSVLSISLDGHYGISGSGKFLIIWNLLTGKELAKFCTQSRISAISCFGSGIFGGEASGRTFLLKADNNFWGPHPHEVIATIRSIWDFEFQQNLPLSADCPLCGHRFAPPDSVLATIGTITKKAGLKPEQSPCLELPNEAWEDSGLLGNCPKCEGELKFNPFIAGGDY